MLSGEWTNKRLEDNNKNQTSVISCRNIIFIMTTNACRSVIEDYAKNHKEDIYLSQEEVFVDAGRNLESTLRRSLQYTHPFTEAFIGRVGGIVPFLPLARNDVNKLEESKESLLLDEMLTITKILIDKQQDECLEDENIQVDQLIDSNTKHSIAKIIVQRAIPEAGVRHIEKLVKDEMGERLLDSILRKKTGIKSGSTVTYHTHDGDIRFRPSEAGEEVEFEDYMVEDDLWS